MRGIIEEPKGLTYAANFLSEEAEQRLLAYLKTLDFHQVIMHGQAAKRTVKHFGMHYDYTSRRVWQGDPMPRALQPLVQKAETFAGLKSGQLVETLITKYPIGAAIGWHHDAPVFDTIVGISLSAPCIIQFQRGTGEQRRVFERILNPRSIYTLRGDVRDYWQHHIPPTTRERYSITFRSLR